MRDDQSGRLRLFKWLAILGVILALTVTLWWLRQKAGPQVTNGGITLHRLLCNQPEEGKVLFRVFGVNDTLKDLRDLRVDLSVGNDGNVITKTRRLEWVPKGGVIDLEESLEYPGTLNVCFSKFYLGNQQIATRFQP